MTEKIDGSGNIPMMDPNVTEIKHGAKASLARKFKRSLKKKPRMKVKKL